jgi:hypothetical protein
MLPLQGCQLTKCTRSERLGCIPCRLERAQSASLQLPSFLRHTFLSGLLTTPTSTAQSFVLLPFTARYKPLLLLQTVSSLHPRGWRFLRRVVTPLFA